MLFYLLNKKRDECNPEVCFAAGLIDGALIAAVAIPLLLILAEVLK